MKVKPKLIIGLGNPGKEYEKTYHNVGFWAIDFLAKNPLFARLLKSNSYMNHSGFFVAKASKKYGAKPDQILIIHDDSDIELGKYKVSFGRGSAGHRGVESTIKSLGTKNFWRLRIGIRRKVKSEKRKEKREKASEMVLKKINKKDLEILKKVFRTVANFILQNSI
jgi:PTH1 family peptidyl-tRNA hydrolase